MKAIVQRVLSSSVYIDGTIHAKIDKGLCVLIGYCKDDDISVNLWFADKLLGLRIFEDEQKKMNVTLLDIHGSLLIIPNFTLCADTQKGHRPSFFAAETPDRAESLFNDLLSTISEKYPSLKSGVFGADMHIEINNHGPVTLIYER